MKLSGQELTDGMKGALDAVRDTASSAVNKAKDFLSPGTDEDKKKLLGSGMAKQTADLITKRKKDLDAAMGE